MLRSVVKFLIETVSSIFRGENFPVFRQLDAMDCGPACLRMIGKFYGRTLSLQTLRDSASLSREGVSLLGISDAAEVVGFRTRAVRLPFDKLEEAPLPCIVHWKQSHFVVVHKIDSEKVYVADPAFGLISYSHREFKESWISTKVEGLPKGVAMLLEPGPDFYSQGEATDKAGFAFLYSYLLPYKRYIIQLILGLLVGSILQLVFPFLTQAIVDFGIGNQDIGFIYTLLIAQLVLYASQASVNFIRSWILLHVSARINISFISDFLIKLMKLPIAFFDTKMIGDLLQRIGDHRRIETFLTSTSLNIIFSVLNLIIFGIVLLIYSYQIFGVFLVGSIISTTWIYLLMQKRREVDFKRFEEQSKNQSQLIQLIQAMPEIKLNGCEKQKRWEWEQIQAKLFRVSIKGLMIDQHQQAGSLFINEFKNIIISFLAAKSVIDGDMTLGMLVAVQYIIGQLNAPIGQLISFFRAAQDAKISLERMAEIHENDDEEDLSERKSSRLPELHTIQAKELTFSYAGATGTEVLKDIELNIPQGKITAVVGASGSGKTTLLKLLLKFYPPTKGEIYLGDSNLANIGNHLWRSKCGVVMQDGFVFSDSIARNIAIGEDSIDLHRLSQAAKISNVDEFTRNLPLGFNTKIGSDGINLSQGQKQRILIARAVYKNPEFLFFDEATSSLDANNERSIMDNLNKFFEGKTVVVIAHRLSTVKNADQIVVLDAGKIVEKGTHDELTSLKGAYYKLVKNQLELGH